MIEDLSNHTLASWQTHVKMGRNTAVARSHLVQELTTPEAI